MDLKELYKNNADFKEYVDRCCKNTNMNVETALSQKIIEFYADYLRQEGRIQCKNTEPILKKSTTIVACGVDEN